MTEPTPGTDDGRDLDGRIRDLVARAVADSPPAPDLDDRLVTLAESTDSPGISITAHEHDTPTADRRRWLIGGMTGLSIAAALVAILLLARPDEVTAPVLPATDPGTGTQPAATVAIEPTTVSTPVPGAVAPTTGPVATSGPTAPSNSATSSPGAGTPTTSPPATTPTTEAAATPTGRADLRVRSGSNGVEILGADGRTVTSEPMAVARLGTDDRVYVQRSDALRDTGADTSLLVVDAGPPNPVPVPAALDRPLRLHDSAVIDGATVLLVEGGATSCIDPEQCIGVLYAFRPDEGRLDQLDRMNVFESGWEQLSLSDTGVIVGAVSEGPVRSPYVETIPGADGPVPDVAALGLAAEYVDCGDCPQGFAIDRRGGSVAWVTYAADGPDGPTGTATVTVVDIATGDRLTAEISDVDLPIVPVAALGSVPDADGVTRPVVVINEILRDLRVDPAGEVAPVYVDVATGEVDLGTPGARETYE